MCVCVRTGFAAHGGDVHHQVEVEVGAGDRQLRVDEHSPAVFEDLDGRSGVGALLGHECSVAGQQRAPAVPDRGMRTQHSP